MRIDMNNVNELKSALPNYNNCLVNLANSVLAGFGAQTSADTLKLADKYLAKGHKNVVLLLLDAMGTANLEKHLNADGFFRSHYVDSYSSVFPPTTVAATTSVMSGLYPNEHGWLGWDVYYPQLDKNVSVFLNTEQKTEKEGAEPVGVDGSGKAVWDEDSLADRGPVADFHAGFSFCPYESVVDKINKAGGTAYFSMPFMPPFPQTLDEILGRITKLCKEPGKKFIYAYWNEPDSTMHRTGTLSPQTHEMFTSLEDIVEKFASELEDTLLIVTADHGHVDCDNICILDHPEFLKCLKRLPSIEPRTLNMFVKDEYKNDFPKIFKEHFGEGFLILTREEVIADKVFGIGKDREGLEEMIGDYVVLSTSPKAIFMSHYEAQMMPGGHAGLTPEELIIPFIAIEKE
jgi:hypothetical protein